MLSLSNIAFRLEVEMHDKNIDWVYLSSSRLLLRPRTHCSTHCSTQSTWTPLSLFY